MKKWCIKVTEENLPIVGKWFNVNRQGGNRDFTDSDFIGDYLCYPLLDDGYHFDFIKKNDYTELTFEQFKEQILKEPNVLQEILDKIEEKTFSTAYNNGKIDFKDIEQIFSNYLNK